MNKEQIKEYHKAYYQANKEEYKAYQKAYYQAHKEQLKAHYQARKEYKKAYYQAHKEDYKEYQKANKEHYKAYDKAYKKADVNSLGQTKHSIRMKSQHYLKKYGTMIPGYEIHHCCSYAEPYKFIYCSIEMHRLIHSYLREHNINADSNHYEQIKHLLDDTVVLYGLE